MLEHVRSHAPSSTLYLFGCAGVRRVESCLPGPARQAVATIEEMLDRLDRLLTPEEILARSREAVAALNAAAGSTAVRAARFLIGPNDQAAVHAATYALMAVPRADWRNELAAQCDLVRCLFGNPFRPSRLDPTWLEHGGGARDLARVIRSERRFDDLPILADALEDAGCADQELLDHCRHRGPHGRGCWAIRLLDRS
jgi:hypothetical protein